MMQTKVNTDDLGRLARLSCAVVHGIDFPEFGDSQQASKHLLGEINRLDKKYRDDSLLFDIRAAVVSRPQRKHAIYSLTRSLLRNLKGSEARAKEVLSIAPLPVSGPGSLPV